jgi:hypothetical protein
MICLRSNFILRFNRAAGRLKKDEIAFHWDRGAARAVSFKNCLFTSLKFGRNKVDTITRYFQFPSSKKTP